MASFDLGKKSELHNTRDVLSSYLQIQAGVATQAIDSNGHGGDESSQNLQHLDP
jgi:hypothetical protein